MIKRRIEKLETVTPPEQYQPIEIPEDATYEELVRMFNELNNNWIPKFPEKEIQMTDEGAWHIFKSICEDRIGLLQTGRQCND